MFRRRARRLPPVAAIESLEGRTLLAANPLALHSLAGADKVIYLDFDGQVTTGTDYNRYYNGGRDIVSPAYDRDGDPSTFSAAELGEIVRIWQRVAEDFRPFDVDVTTEDPGVERLRRAGPDDTQWGVRAIATADQSWLVDNLGYTVGGITMTQFDASIDAPVFAFNAGEVYAADTLSHEIGHSLGLSHDATWLGTFATYVAYYTGHGSGPTGWAPIMGSGFSKQLSQWSKGEYPNAYNTEDDLAIITTKNGFGYRADDHGDDVASAERLDLASGRASTAGIIERSTDCDLFAIDIVAGELQIAAKPADVGPNLDVLLELLDADGQVIASSNPADALDASLDLQLAPGRYYLRIDGTGKAATAADPGYSDYGSLGAYSIDAAFFAEPATWCFPAAPQLSGLVNRCTPLAWANRKGAKLIFAGRGRVRDPHGDRSRDLPAREGRPDADLFRHRGPRSRWR